MPETYRARHALRDTGRALGPPPHVVDKVAKSFPHIRACDIRGALKELPELRQLATEGGSSKGRAIPRPERLRDYRTTR